MNQTKAYTPIVITEDVKSQLPIFQLIGNNLPEKMQTPEAKKTASKVAFWSILAAITYFFFANISNLLEFAAKGVLFVVFGFVLIVLVSLAPQIIGFLHRIGKTILFKGEQDFVSKNPIASLRLLMEDAKDTMVQVRDRITQVEGVTIEMRSDAESQQREALQKREQVKQLRTDIEVLEEEAKKLEAKGQTEKANAKRREKRELMNSIQLRIAEAESAEGLMNQYSQYGNQFAKVTEKLKDHESGAKIYFNALNSSIKIIDAKMSASKKMKAATEGLAGIFNIKDSWVFDTAMSAATAQISNNLAYVKRNLEDFSSSQVFKPGKVNFDDVDAFLQKTETIKSLNIQEITDASYELSPEQTPDKTLNIL